MSEYKVGDIVECVSGFHSEQNSPHETYGGLGYEEGLVFVVTMVQDYGTRSLTVLFGGKNDHGVFEKCVKHATGKKRLKGLSMKFGL